MVTVRHANDNDLRFLVEYFPEPVDGAHKTRLLRQAYSQNEYMLAEDNNMIVGHILIRWSGPADNLVKSQYHDPEISALYVSSDFRNKGVGTVLMEAAESRIKERGFKSCGLAVRINNPAIALYYNRGFEYLCDAMPTREYPKIARVYLVKNLIR